jgi:imidazolonepropionase-like amidohydrolase
MVFHDEEVIDMIADSNAWMTPTLLHRTDHAIQNRLDQGTSMFVINKMKALQPDCFDTFQKMYKAGVKIAMGTDMGFDPEMGTNAKELEVYVKLGMKPMEAIMTATRNAAHALKMEKELGTVEVGKLADIIAVKGDPLKNITVLQEKKNIQIVMKEGRVYADRRAGHSKNVVNVNPGEWKIIDYL